MKLSRAGVTEPNREKIEGGIGNPESVIRTEGHSPEDEGPSGRPGLKRVFLMVRGVCRIAVSLAALPVAFLFVLIARGSHLIYGKIIESSIVVSRIPFYFGEKVREYYYRGLLLSVGKGVTFKYGSYCQYRNTRIGNRVLIGYFTTLGEVSIGDNVLIGGNVNFLSGLQQHSYSDPKTLIWDTPAPGRRMIHIGSDVWIGSDAVIGNDVGDRCVIAANSFVIRKVKSHTLVGGNPAEILMKI